MRFMNPWVLVVALLIFVFTENVFSSSSMRGVKVLWGVPGWPPFFIKDKSGVGDQMLLLLQKQLTKYQHEDIDVNAPKLVELWQQGRDVCGSNMLYNGERAKYGYFTPLWVYPPLHVIVKEESLEAFTKGEKPISVFELIKNSHFKGILIKGRSYGPPVDDIIAGLSKKDFVSLISPVGNWQDYLNMIPGHRADYTIDYASTAKAFNEGHPNAKRLAAIPILGYEKPFIVNVACPKNSWGKELIKDIDGKIQELAKTREYKDLQEKIFINQPQLQKDVDQFILKRSKGAWIWGSLE